MLDDADLAYMRSTQAEFRPTAAEVRRRTEVPDGRGGRTTALAAPEPIQVRITDGSDATSSDDVPRDLAGRYGETNLWKVVTDLVALEEGDLIHDTERDRWFQVVSNPTVQEWTTAQMVWATATGAPGA